jgi:hypothetical protein
MVPKRLEEYGRALFLMWDQGDVGTIDIKWALRVVP